MAKTVAALNRLGAAGLAHFSVLTDPCYGGVTASYATVADVVMAEPKAMVGFAGPRVIEQTTKQKLPEGFQTAEFLLDHGMVDLIVGRDQLRATTASLLGHYETARIGSQAEASISARAVGEDIVVSLRSMAPERADRTAQAGDTL